MADNAGCPYEYQFFIDAVLQLKLPLAEADTLQKIGEAIAPFAQTALNGADTTTVKLMLVCPEHGTVVGNQQFSVGELRKNKCTAQQLGGTLATVIMAKVSRHTIIVLRI